VQLVAHTTHAAVIRRLLLANQAPVIPYALQTLVQRNAAIAACKSSRPARLLQETTTPTSASITQPLARQLVIQLRSQAGPPVSQHQPARQHQQHHPHTHTPTHLPACLPACSPVRHAWRAGTAAAAGRTAPCPPADACVACVSHLPPVCLLARSACLPAGTAAAAGRTAPCR
jgi:hypothetical protein